MCIGKKFQSTMPFIAFPARINAMMLTLCFLPSVIQTSSANASNSTLDIVNNGTTRLLVGEPIANSSLMA